MSEAYVRRGPMVWNAGDDPREYLTTLYIRFLQGFLNQTPQDHEFHWEPSPELSKVLIRGDVLDREYVEKFPSIVVVLGPLQSMGLVIDNFVRGNLFSGDRYHTDLLSGALACYAIAGNEAMASRLGHYISHGTVAMRRLLESPEGFHRIARPGAFVNQPSPPGALVSGNPESLVMVQVSVPFEYQFFWRNTEVAKPQDRGLERITKYPRAADYPYETPPRTQDVTLQVRQGANRYRAVGSRFRLDPFTDDTGDGNRTVHRVSLRRK